MDLTGPLKHPAFMRYIGIDYSGAATPDARLKGLRIYEASQASMPSEVLPPIGSSKYWTRRGIASWLAERLAEKVPTLVGIDHGFSFPWCYFEAHGLALDWATFLDDFQHHWPTDAPNIDVDFIRKRGGDTRVARTGNTRWRRITEIRARAKSVFHFDVPGSVAKSTHAGLPWLRWLRDQLPEQVHFWPFEGWELPEGKSALLEIYPSLWSREYPREDRTPDQHDAYVAAAKMQELDQMGYLGSRLHPNLTPEERLKAQVEGWILGVM